MKYSAQRSRSPFSAAVNPTHVLAVVWVVAVVWYELGTFFWSVSSCRWPDKALKEAGLQGRPTHVLIVADPQVLDGRSYPGRSWFLSKLTQFIVDLNLRKSWTVAKRFNPDVVVFLGDMMDNGRFASDDDEYRAYYKRFKSIFAVDPSANVHYIPGNHDVGLGNSRTFSPLSRKRYTDNFGPVNHQISVANHTLVFLDAPGLVEEDYRRASSAMSFERWPAPPGGAVDFVRNFAAAGSAEPVILFSHIPLFRPDTAKCGPLREKGTIRRGVGFGYQNTLERRTSEFLIQNLRPVGIYSGDDHDYCEYMHVVPLAPESSELHVQHVREVTVKSFSMAMGIERPGFQLLSLAPSSLVPVKQTFADTPCFLPNQIRIYVLRYVPLLILSVLYLAVINHQKANRQKRRPGSLDLSSPLTPSARQAYTQHNSAVWAASTPVSPHGGLRSRSPSPSPGLMNSARTPRSPNTPNGTGATIANGLVPTYRAFNTISPLPSPGFLSAGTPNMVSVPLMGTEEEDGPVAPSQYVTRPGHTTTVEPKNDYFQVTSGRQTRSRHRWSLSWTFVFRGRRRRVALNVPSFIVGTSNHGRSGQRSFIRCFLTDVLVVAWPAGVVFVLICLLMFS